MLGPWNLRLSCDFPETLLRLSGDSRATFRRFPETALKMQGVRSGGQGGPNTCPFYYLVTSSICFLKAGRFHGTVAGYGFGLWEGDPPIEARGKPGGGDGVGPGERCADRIAANKLSVGMIGTSSRRGLSLTAPHHLP